ncbi:MAG: hypothetical protein VR64_21950 [Desulfatitalea sp. BRH_c12]|nr:MAG: hypothetical protein VR64_21950 [Desulfatitalea sp. BRH_c12]
MNICLKQNGLFPTFLTLLMLFFLFLVSCSGGGDGDATVPQTALDRAIELKGEDESAGSCSDTIMQEFALNEIDCLSILNAAGYSSVEIGEMLRDRYGYDGNKAAKLLDDANFDLNSMNIVMKTVYNLNPIQVESVMENTLQYSQEEYLGKQRVNISRNFLPFSSSIKRRTHFLWTPRNGSMKCYAETVVVQH